MCASIAGEQAVRLGRNAHLKQWESSVIIFDLSVPLDARLLLLL